MCRSSHSMGTMAERSPPEKEVLGHCRRIGNRQEFSGLWALSTHETNRHPSNSQSTTGGLHWVRYVCGALALLVLGAGLYFSQLSGTDPRVYSNDFNVFYHAA